MPLILLLDRNIEFCEALREGLERHGFDAIVASTVDGALEECRRGRVNAVVADVSTIHAHLKDFTATVTAASTTKALITSGFDQGYMLEHYLPLMMQFPFLGKPFGPSELRENLSKLLNGNGDAEPHY
jgi:DNA-binding response OmpR family regulator